MAPTLSAEGKAKLDQILKSNVESGEIPGSTFAIATPDANAPLVYWGTAGDRHFGDPSKGQINEDTGGHPHHSPLTPQCSSSCR